MPIRVYLGSYTFAPDHHDWPIAEFIPEFWIWPNMHKATWVYEHWIHPPKGTVRLSIRAPYYNLEYPYEQNLVEELRNFLNKIREAGNNVVGVFDPQNDLYDYVEWLAETFGRKIVALKFPYGIKYHFTADEFFKVLQELDVAGPVGSYGDIYAFTRFGDESGPDREWWLEADEIMSKMMLLHYRRTGIAQVYVEPIGFALTTKKRLYWSDRDESVVPLEDQVKHLLLVAYRNNIERVAVFVNPKYTEYPKYRYHEEKDEAVDEVKEMFLDAIKKLGLEGEVKVYSTREEVLKEEEKRAVQTAGGWKLY